MVRRGEKTVHLIFSLFAELLKANTVLCCVCDHLFSLQFFHFICSSVPLSSFELITTSLSLFFLQHIILSYSQHIHTTDSHESTSLFSLTVLSSPSTSITFHSSLSVCCVGQFSRICFLVVSRQITRDDWTGQFRSVLFCEQPLSLLSVIIFAGDRTVAQRAV